jgi:hypothetical protein
VALPDDLLDDHRHLLRRRRSINRVAIRSCGGEERGRIDELDSFDQPAEARVGGVLVVGDHLGGVHPGERVRQRILQQRRRTDGERRVHLFYQTAQIAHQLHGEIRELKGVGDPVVGGSGLRDRREVVPLHEGVEHVGADDRQPRQHDADLREGPRTQTRQDRVAGQGQAQRLAAQGAGTDAREGLVAGKEASVEAGEHQIQPRSLQAEATRLTAIT